MTTKYGKIKALWDQVGGFDFEKPPHLQAVENEARKADAALSKEFEPWVEAWKEGLISSTELFDQLYHVAFTKIE